MVKGIRFQHFYERLGSIVVSRKLVFLSMISCDFVTSLSLSAEVFVGPLIFALHRSAAVRHRLAGARITVVNFFTRCKTRGESAARIRAECAVTRNEAAPLARIFISKIGVSVFTWGADPGSHGVNERLDITCYSVP